MGDIRDYDSVRKAIKGCDVVFHLAALIGIPYSYVSPLAYIKTNVEGTYNVLEASKNFKLKEVIITSTSETYGTAKYIPIEILSSNGLVIKIIPNKPEKIAVQRHIPTFSNKKIGAKSATNTAED